MKKFLAIVIAVSLSLAVSMPSAIAGPAQHHRWEGVAIGVGAAIVGSAILHNAFDHREVQQVAYSNSCSYPPPVYRQPTPPNEPCGHWEIRKSWVAPVYERVWNPAHYNEYGQWVKGQWIQFEKRPGFWKEERVWR